MGSTLLNLVLLLLLQYARNACGIDLPEPPKTVEASALDARVIRVQWIQVSSAELRSFNIRVSTSTESGSMSKMFTVTPASRRSYNIGGIRPFSYNSSTGQRFTVEVSAVNSIGESDYVPATGFILLPPCPGSCDYRRFTTSTPSCSSTCVCNPSHEGTDCDMPTYIPGNVTAELQVAAGQPSLNVTWADPSLVSLHGRQVEGYEVNVQLLQDTLQDPVLTLNVSSASNMKSITNNPIISSTYSVFHYAVTVRTRTDEPDDITAVAPAVLVATHPPEPVLNLITTSFDSTSLTITWEAPIDDFGLVTSYDIVITDEFSTTTFLLSATETSSSITGLEPNTTYSISVSASNSFGAGELRSIMSTTAVATPTIPPDTEDNTAIIIIAVVIAVGVTLLLCCLTIFTIICCFCARRTRRMRQNTFSLTDRYEAVNRPSVVVPANEYDGEFGGTYSEIPPELPQRKPLPYLELKKTATPKDYDNEELYMEMAKIYFEDPAHNDILAAYEIDRTRITLMEEIGKGEFGRVMKASAEHVIPGEPTSTVAVKMLKDKTNEKMQKDFLGEAQLLAKFGSHPNIMGLLKVVVKSCPQLVIISYMPHGDLRQYLKKCANASEKNYSVSTIDQLYISEQIAAGMEYLASKFFVHRDLATRNVLVGEKNLVKISDFGLSRILHQENSYYKVSHNHKLPVKWMALESLLYQKFSTYSDVWSFGVVLWEIFSFGQTPYKGISAVNITRHIQDGARLPCPQDCPKDVYQTMSDCWKESKEERPTFTQLKLQLKALGIRIKSLATGVPVEDIYDDAGYIKPAGNVTSDEYVDVF